jgi:hypothetical protein
MSSSSSCFPPPSPRPALKLPHHSSSPRSLSARLTIHETPEALTRLTAAASPSANADLSAEDAAALDLAWQKVTRASELLEVEKTNLLDGQTIVRGREDAVKRREAEVAKREAHVGEVQRREATLALREAEVAEREKELAARAAECTAADSQSLMVRVVRAFFHRTRSQRDVHAKA